MTTHANAYELAPENAWFKSSYSDGQGQSCVEVADLTPHPAGGDDVGIRDSKNPQGPALTLGLPAWKAFLAGLR
ncbi:DUF397 domain-containing protein [Streptomyces aureoverticillatus]|uniref:DUF397 domain-containing protein n=1 Tax=Streptomyces aureoverticillatus TaxID=66871 RepID=UPI0013DC1946|nr:DUF397 domain-containing protein [Streptomyces aureoverticillatus]QIB43482.1 DUF397 domain-containing protein [Streptomyces aureoverticillatus]